MAKTKLSTLQKTYLKRMDSLLLKQASFGDFLSLLQRSNDNYVAQKSREENKLYDEKWIANLEEGFAAIDAIVQNPRTFIREDAQVVLAALAKKINARSVQNLAMHSEYVRNVDKEGNVTPDKILSISAEEDYQIYENRFVMTLVKKLVIFIERRYQFIKDHGETTNSDVLLIHNATTIDGVTYECDNRIKVSRPSDDNGQKEKNTELLEKIVQLRARASFYLDCPFMRKMAGAKPVHNPLSMTNILLKNPTYHKAYELWKFIDSYQKLGITYSVKETNQEFDEDYFRQIYGLVIGGVLTLHSHLIDPIKVTPSLAKKKTLTPRVLLSLDDETFLDGKFTYREFPEPSDNQKREKGTMAPGKEDLEKIKIAEQKRAFDEARKAEEIAAKQAEWKRQQDIKEAVAAAAKRKKLEARLAQIVTAQKALAEKMERERLAKEKAAAEKARQEQIRLEAQLLEKTREGVLREAVEDKTLDVETLAKLERQKKKALALAAKEAAKAAEREKAEASLQKRQAVQKTAIETALVQAKLQETALEAAAELSKGNAKLHVVKLKEIRQQKFVPIVSNEPAPQAAPKAKPVKIAAVVPSDESGEKGPK